MLTSNEATVTVDISCRRGGVTAVADQPTTVSPLDNDTEEGDDITLTEVGEPNRGTRERIGDDVKYTPEAANEDERLRGSYEAVAAYSIEERDVASSTIICNQPPTANVDSKTTTESRPIDIPVAGENTDAEDDSIKVTEITEEPEYGEASTTRTDACDDLACSYQDSYAVTFKYNVIETATTEKLVSGNDATVAITIECK